jgi:hypothetical protein
VDITRLFVYGAGFYAARFRNVSGTGGYVLAASLAAFAGAYFGKYLIRKVTYRAIQVLVADMLILLGAGLATGFI